jgi:hypothetical protein
MGAGIGGSVRGKGGHTQGSVFEGLVPAHAAPVQ